MRKELKSRDLFVTVDGVEYDHMKDAKAHELQIYDDAIKTLSPYIKVCTNRNDKPFAIPSLLKDILGPNVLFLISKAHSKITLDELDIITDAINTIYNTQFRQNESSMVAICNMGKLRTDIMETFNVGYPNTVFIIADTDYNISYPFRYIGRAAALSNELNYVQNVLSIMH